MFEGPLHTQAFLEHHLNVVPPVRVGNKATRRQRGTDSESPGGNPTPPLHSGHSRDTVVFLDRFGHLGSVAIAGKPVLHASDRLTKERRWEDWQIG